ncbi:ZIP family metal transporter [Patescibacteria group bacterium]
MKEKLLSKILLLMVSLSTGALMGGAFIHLLPEASEHLDPVELNMVVLVAFITFFFIEKIFHWRHCHKGECDVHTFGYMNLVGDALHNFIDGMLIAAAFMTNINLGIVTTFAVSLHEIPQEIGDFGVLLYSGFSKKKAILSNFFVALIAIAGGILGYILSGYSEGVSLYLLPFAAGGFIYIAASDLMPEIRKVKTMKESFATFGVFLVGIFLMFLLKFVGVE